MLDLQSILFETILSPNWKVDLFVAGTILWPIAFTAFSGILYLYAYFAPVGLLIAHVGLLIAPVGLLIASVVLIYPFSML